MLVGGPYFHLAHLAAPVDRALLGLAKGELTFVPLSAGCRVAGEAVALGEAVLLTDPSAIEIDEGSRALLTWPACRRLRPPPAAPPPTTQIARPDPTPCAHSNPLAEPA